MKGTLVFESLMHIAKQKKKEEDPVKDKITFTRPWIIEIPPTNAAKEIVFRETFVTCYKFESKTWYMKLSKNEIRIETNFVFDRKSDLSNLWNESCCFISYNLFYDNDMRFLLYSSKKIAIQKVSNADIFLTPVGFLARMAEAYDQRKIVKIVIFVEIQLPAKNFYFPPILYLGEDSYKEYPSDIDQDDRFQFLKDGDFVIKCPDGEMPALRKCLKKESGYIMRYFDTSKNNELVVEHSIDVIKPIIIYFHTRCFKMPKTFDLDYAKRLLNAFYFFEPKYAIIGKTAIAHWLCKKFVREYHDFDSILQWASFAIRHSFPWLETLLATVIADKFYFEWQLTFPADARNIENPLFFAIFGSKPSSIFRRIDITYKRSFLTNVILD